ncbi:MAG: NADH-quinone oxidoreductase subunit A [Planctomycetes bacterium]|nr:NADH-quinone oxidoreductase subunit A [Planctomycetota bacterium]
MTLPLTLATGLEQYAPIGILLLIAIAFALVNLIGSTILGPSRTGPVKESVYETGMNPIGTARKRFNIRFYILAMTFLVFDVEIVFLYPWAQVFANLDMHTFLAPQFLFRMLFFIATSIVAFLYAWRKGVFAFD